MKAKKSNRVNMLAKLKKEIFEEGLKSALNTTITLTNRKGNTTPLKLTSSKTSRLSDQ